MSNSVLQSHLRKFGVRGGLLIILLSVSFLGTYIGVSQYIAANYGRLDVMHGLMVGFIVLVITALMAYAVDRVVSPGPGIVSRVFWLVLYLVIAGVSVGFAFGFWWSVMEARNATNRAVAEDVARIEQGLVTTDQQLGLAIQSLTTLAQYSRNQALVESRDGGTCGDQSSQGQGPRAALRQRHANLFGGVADELGGRLAPIRAGVSTGLAAVRETNRAALSANSAQRVQMLTQSRGELEALARAVNGLRNDPQLRATAREFAEIAPLYDRRLGFTDPASNAAFTCQDERIKTALLGASQALSGIEELAPPRYRIFEGAEATLEAFQRLGRSMAALVGVESVEGELLNAHDSLPLLIAAIIDFGVLAISVDRDRSKDPPKPSRTERAIERNIIRTIRRRPRSHPHGGVANSLVSWRQFLPPDLLALLVEENGRHFFVIPGRVQDGELQARIASIRGVVLAAGGRKTKAVIRYITRSNGRADTRARALLAAQHPEADWSRATQFDWFEIREPDGIERLGDMMKGILHRHQGASGAPQRPGPQPGALSRIEKAGADMDSMNEEMPALLAEAAAEEHRKGAQQKVEQHREFLRAKADVEAAAKRQEIADLQVKAAEENERASKKEREAAVIAAQTRVAEEKARRTKAVLEREAEEHRFAREAGTDKTDATWRPPNWFGWRRAPFFGGE